MQTNKSIAAVTNKQTLIMSDLSSSSSHGVFNNVHISSSSEDYKNTPSPTSILDAKSSPEASFASPFKHSTIKSEAIGLALIDSFVDGQETTTAMSCCSSSPSKAVIDRMVLLGKKLKVQIPANHQSSPAASPRSPADFGIKTRNNVVSQLVPTSTPAREFRRQLSLKEMELSEDYTCVISHGPNPKTTHIFDDCIVNGDVTELFSEVKTASSAGVVSFCHACKKVIGQGEEMNAYRGSETVFCSEECSCQEKISEL